MKTIVLASSSPARRELLTRLQIPFEIARPDVDETPLAQETPVDMVQRLAQAKARKIAQQFPQALIVGCDQVIVVDNEIMGKPKDHDDAVVQLTKMSGRRVLSFTGLCLLNASVDRLQCVVERYTVQFRKLNHEMIVNYLKRDTPYHCAGSLKAESLGVALFEFMEGRDPHALIGLPLIQLVRLLENEGVNLLEAVGNSTMLAEKR